MERLAEFDYNSLCFIRDLFKFSPVILILICLFGLGFCLFAFFYSFDSNDDEEPLDWISRRFYTFVCSLLLYLTCCGMFLKLFVSNFLLR